MKERPILFSTPMVRAILDGRKTQTRRANMKWSRYSEPNQAKPPLEWCPYGKPGDRLWVRETWGQAEGVWEEWEYHRGKADRHLPVLYRADNPTLGADDEYWRPSIFMPRWASRITLEVTGVGVERLQNISEQNACAEGYDDSGLQPATMDAARDWFRVMWDQINAKRQGCSWNENPLVWTITFRRIDA